MTRAELLDLAVRVEAATEADQDEVMRDVVASVCARWTPARRAWIARALDAECYESVAMALVPAGMCFSVVREESGLFVACIWLGSAVRIRARPTAALALVAAALRAMAEEAGDE